MLLPGLMVLMPNDSFSPVNLKALDTLVRLHYFNLNYV